MEISINIISVEIGTNIYHLKFTGYVPHLDVNKKFKFDYIGTETKSNSSLSTVQLKRLTEELKNNFGYAPFDLEKAKEILNDGIQYRIEM